MITDLILGTAGHIDHGKTSLIRALTGVDTDRLPEEKRRGITIDLGFAELTVGDYRLGIVDVPGHERFVRNMLAGATGTDLAMLVVAADDSIKPQTREHLEILRLLNLKAGVIAITKCDLVEPDWIDLVEEEVRELASGTFLDGAAIVRTSVQDGRGLDPLRLELAAAAERVGARQHTAAPFRMAIDRAFTLAGHGTVVTGSVSSGGSKVGDELLIEPGGLRVRVRGLQNHDRSVEHVHRGQRAAVNLAGVHHESIRRGQELTSPGHLRPSRLFTARLALLDSAPRGLKNRSRVRLHIGAAELMSAVVLLDQERLAPGERAMAQLHLSQPAVMTWRQPLVLRSESPMTTIGGGCVLDPCAERLRRGDSQALELLELLDSPDAITRSSAALFFAGLRDWRPADLARTAGVETFDAMRETLLEHGELREIPASPTRTLRLHRLVFDRLCDRIEAALENLHAKNPLQSMLDRARLASGFRYLGDEALLDAVLQFMHETGRLRLSEKSVALAGHGPKLSQNERKLMAQLIEKYRQAGGQPPTVRQCQQEASSNAQSVPQLIQLAAADGQLVKLSPQLYLHADVERDYRDRLTVALSNSEGLTLSKIREMLNTTRRYAVPYCEYLDRIGFTERRADLRVLARRDRG